MIPSSLRVAEVTGSAFGVGALLVVGLLSGVDLWVVTIDLLLLSMRIVFFEGMVTVGLFTAFVVLTGNVLVRAVWGDRNHASGGNSGPELRAIIPAYRDADVLDIPVESLLESPYDQLTVDIVVEPDDPRTRAQAETLADQYEAVSCLVNGRPGSKAGAINDAVQRSSADYFAVFDADERVSTRFVPTAMAALQDGVDVFQGRRIPRPTGPIETVAYCERVIVRAGYAFAELFGFTQCQSAATAFHREAFERVGGYEDRLTEDIDFAHKCYQADLTVSRNRRCVTTMEAPHSLRDIWGQRKRWRIGHVEVVHQRVREAPRRSLGVSNVLSLGRATGGIVVGAFLLLVTGHVALLLLQGFESAFFVPYGCALGIVGGVWLRDFLDGHVVVLSWSALLVPFVYVGHGALTVKAVLEYHLTWNGEWYRVTKLGT